MKKLIKPLVATTLILTATGAYSQGYTVKKNADTIFSMDDNGDKKVNFQEFFEETVTDNNDSFDVNKDGYITSGEIVLEIKEDLIQSINEMRKQGVSEKDINKTIANELNTAEKEAEKLIRKMDADGDNLVEPDELKAYKEKQFDALDTNDDGYISSSDASKKKSEKFSSYHVVPYQP
jgi:Ca2+-binding EF-hand superfamily protein